MKEDKSKSVGYLISFIFHLSLIVAGWFITAFEETDQKEGGTIEVSFVTSKAKVPVKPVKQEIEQQPKVEQKDIQEVKVAPEETQEQPAQDKVEVNPGKGEPIIEKPVEKNKTEKAQPKQENKPDNPKVNPETTLGPANKSNDNTQEESKPVINQDAVLNERNKKSNTAPSKGASLDMPGWKWTSKPKPNDNSSETGTIVIGIQIDDLGEIINVSVISSNLSRHITERYIESVKNISFQKENEGTATPMLTNGRITFIVEAK
jgi:outer membrane biosynthesis protein TonB